MDRWNRQREVTHSAYCPSCAKKTVSKRGSDVMQHVLSNGGIAACVLPDVLCCSDQCKLLYLARLAVMHAHLPVNHQAVLQEVGMLDESAAVVL